MVGENEVLFFLPPKNWRENKKFLSCSFTLCPSYEGHFPLNIFRVRICYQDILRVGQNMVRLSEGGVT